LTEYDVAVFGRIFDLEGAKRNANNQIDSFTKAGNSEMRYLFSIPIM
jgi:hypothetical protein